MKYYWLYIGHNITKEKSKRFVLETEKIPSIDSAHFSGRVVALGDKAPPYHLGYSCNDWCNPIWDILQGHCAEFVQIPEYQIREMFPNNNL